MSSTSKEKIEKDRIDRLFAAFDRNYPTTLTEVETMFGGTGFSRRNLHNLLQSIGAEPAHERIGTDGRVWSRWWWPYDIARAVWGEDVAKRVVRVRPFPHDNADADNEVAS